jgi:uncharacterized surface protein with fasciclin (FAS1) repeats
MKLGLLTLLFTVIACTAALAQNSPPPRGSSFQDSVRAQNSSGKTVMVNGTAMNSAKDFVENLTPATNYTLFLAAARAASIIGTLKSRGPLTVFAPSDSAFRQKLGLRLDTLMKPERKYELINILSYHIVAGNYNAKDLAKMIKNGNGEAALLTLSGSKLTARLNENRNIVLYDETGGQSVISTFDVEQSNGLMHLVNQVLIPRQKAL